MPARQASFGIAKCLLTTLALLPCLLQVTSAESDTRTCYDYNDTAQPGSRPCYSPSTKTISHCCSTTDTCVADTLCLSQFGTLYIGSCTVTGWGDGSAGRGDCPKYYSYCTGRRGHIDWKAVETDDQCRKRGLGHRGMQQHKSSVGVLLWRFARHRQMLQP